MKKPAFVSAPILLAVTSMMLTGCGSKSSPTATSPTAAAASAGATTSTPAASSGATSTTSASAKTAALDPNSTVPAGGSLCPQNSGYSPYHFARFTSAEAGGDNIVVTATPARLTCSGGDSDHTYEPNGTATKYTFSKAAKVVFVVTPGPREEPGTAGELPLRLRSSQSSNVYQLIGDTSAPTSAQQLYQP